MPVLINRPRGTSDFLPGETGRWRYVEKTLLETAARFGFREIRTPVFEHTELFRRGVGDTTDVVTKEMYTFSDKGNRSMTLRPEGTAGITRAAIENGLLNGPLPVKLSYLMDCFRYEKSQKGRFRQFRQFGVECFGPGEAAADAEMIALAFSCLRTLGLNGMELTVNSIGCPVCRADYRKALTEWLERRRTELCDTCRTRLDRNPMRILDCKEPGCRKIAAGAPKTTDFLCPGCRAHFDELRGRLTAAEIPHSADPGIVRGLDYYTRTVFEIAVPGLPALCGGGRYGKLVETLGGPDMEGIGFAMGLERLVAAMEDQGAPFPEEETCDLFIASVGREASQRAFRLVMELRERGISAECDLMGRSVKAQMKFADRLRAKESMVIGDRELETGGAVLRNMKTGGTKTADLEAAPLARALGEPPENG